MVTTALIVYGALGPRGFGRSLALGGATPAGAAVVLGDGIAVPTFYAVAVGTLAALVLRLLRDNVPGSTERPLPVPASRPLVMFVVVSVLVTLVAPLLFDGLLTATPAGLAPLSAGVLTKSNIAQVVYLVLGVAVIAYLARSRWTGPELVGLATCVATLLSLWAWTSKAAGVPFPAGLFDNSPIFVYQETLPTGAPRVRGIFTEPASLAASCLVTTAYCASRLTLVSGFRRLGLIAVVGAALYLGFISTSTTFFVAGVALAAIAVVAATARFILRGAFLGSAAGAVLCAVAVAALFYLPVLANSIGQRIVDKVGTSSYEERSGADTYAFQLLADTYGFGTGLGSNRASSFVSTTLSTVGVVGMFLFVAVVVILIRRGWPVRAVRPALWALVALLICKVVSGPDLSDPTGVLWLSLGVLANAALRKGTLRGGGQSHRREPAAEWLPSRSRREVDASSTMRAPEL